MSRRQLVVLLLLSALMGPTVVAQEKHFERVEQFPNGPEIKSLLGGLGLKDVNVDQHSFDAPFERVWAAAKGATELFAKISHRPIVSSDAQAGRIQIGRISQDALVGMSSFSWAEETTVEVTKILETVTRVTVARKVVQKELFRDRVTGAERWTAAWSNGKIERWLLTEVEDDLSSQAAAIDYSKTALGRYLRIDKPKDVIELREDGTLLLRQGGKDYTGRYEIQGARLMMMVGQGAASVAKLQQGALLDPGGAKWIKQ